MHSKPVVKPTRKSKMCPHKRFSEIVLGKRLWLEHVCKVCAQLALLLKFYKGSRSETFFAPFVPPWRNLYVLYKVLTLAGKEMVRIPHSLLLAGKEIV